MSEESPDLGEILSRYPFCEILSSVAMQCFEEADRAKKDGFYLTAKRLELLAEDIGNMIVPEVGRAG